MKAGLVSMQLIMRSTAMPKRVRDEIGGILVRTSRVWIARKPVSPTGPKTKVARAVPSHAQDGHNRPSLFMTRSLISDMSSMAKRIPSRPSPESLIPP